MNIIASFDIVVPFHDLSEHHRNGAFISAFTASNKCQGSTLVVP
jgi:hypothetical protein